MVQNGNDTYAISQEGIFCDLKQFLASINRKKEIRFLFWNGGSIKWLLNAIFLFILDRGFKPYFRENFRVFFGKVSNFETGVLYRISRISGKSKVQKFTANALT